MLRTSPLRRCVRAALAVAFWAVVVPPAQAQRFLPDDPVLFDRDDLPIPPPAEIELSNGYDVFENTLRPAPDRRDVPSARNVNTLGEVPDSSWWTNRIGVRPMSLAELSRGPNDGDGPDTSAPWTVIRGKSGGITPGFTIRDARGDVYFIKFDPVRYFGLSTGADVVGSKTPSATTCRPTGSSTFGASNCASPTAPASGSAASNRARSWRPTWISGLRAWRACPTGGCAPSPAEPSRAG
jgi:hypothetical protein